LQRYKKYKYKKRHVLSSSSLNIVSLFILLIYSLSITGVAYIVPQTTAYTNTTSNSLNVLNTSLYDSNQNQTAQTAAKIFVEKSGGFAGIRMSTEVDIHSLPPDEAHKIQGMIDNAKEFFDLKESSSPPEDTFDYETYEITVQTEEGKQNTIKTYRPGTPSDLETLINYLEKYYPFERIPKSSN
jgi:hypothetical protein